MNIRQIFDCAVIIIVGIVGVVTAPSMFHMAALFLVYWIGLMVAINIKRD